MVFEMYIKSLVDGETVSGRTFQWTTTPPTEPGWYWACSKNSIEVVQISAFSGSVWVTGKNGSCNKSRFTHWIGPLPMPDPPEKG